MDQQLICLWVFVMVLLLLTTFHKRENFESDAELGPLGTEAGTAAQDVIYQAVYRAHSQACAILNKNRKKRVIVAVIEKQLESFPNEPLQGEQLKEFKEQKKQMLEMVENQIKQIEDDTGLNGDSLRRLGKKYVDVLANKVKNGKKPSKKFIEKQYDNFVKAFCNDIDKKDLVLVPIVKEKLEGFKEFEDLVLEDAAKQEV